MSLNDSKYGQLPVDMGKFDVECAEMLFYQYLPIKMRGQARIDADDIERRLHWTLSMVGAACCDAVATIGLDQFVDSYVYISAKKMWQYPHQSFNRPGWHSDGFMTNDLNYIWSDCIPTVFNSSKFDLTMDDERSLDEMSIQAKRENDITYPDKHLLRLNQYNIHKVGDIPHGVMRTFLKISISKDKYDLKGNSVNPLLDYNWEMRKRGEGRNIPQKL